MSNLANDCRTLETEGRKQPGQQGGKLLVVAYPSRPGRAYMLEATIVTR